jgi:IS30 family transposase
MHRDLLVNSRKGINATPEELIQASDIFYKGNKKGQSISHITYNHRDEITWSLKTSYNYHQLGLFRTKYHDLPVAPTMKKRKKKSIQHKVDTKCLEGRSYTDYKNFIAENPNAAVVELDSVIGRIGGKVLLTMNFNRCGGLMLAFIRDFNTSQSVIDVFSMLENKLGLELFQKLFPVFLTDNGGEFTNPVKLETSIDGSTKRTTIFYCDPYSSWQKGRVENNHKNLRKILLKGTSFDNLTQEDIDLAVSHVNSLSRQSLNGKSSYEVFSLIFGTEILDLLNVKKIAANDVILLPELLSNK